ncbi:MAG: YidC/Oxa1 family insertase periplasmic-domain containing protein [Lentisphaeria bacterium]|jgi:YidC/Oxa1 family membrane protein insertase
MDKKSLAAIALCVVLILAWNPLLRQLGLLPAPEPPASGPAAAATPAEPPPLTTAASQATATAAAPAAVALEPAPTATGAAATGTPAFANLAVPGFYQAHIDLRTGALAEVELEQYPNDARTAAMTLGHAGRAAGEIRLAGQPLAGQGPAVVVEQAAQRLVLERPLADGLVLRQEWAAVPDRPYQLAYTVRFRNTGTVPLELKPMTVLAGLMELPAAQAKGGWGAPADLAASVAFAGESRAKLYNPKGIGKAKAEERRELAGRRTAWAAAHTKYFLVAMAGEAPAAGAELETGSAAGGEPDAGEIQFVAANLLLPPATVAAGGELAQRFTVYAGPKELARLRALGNGLDSVLQMDLFFFFHPQWMGSVSRLILGGMLWVQRQIGAPWAYGVAIILITVLVKFLFWPLTHYSTISMKKMQGLQPLMAGLKEKYKDSPQLMQQKIMELYREHKVNPLGGCLPILLQIPVFFALFNVFRGAIELRQAPFLWVADLSQPDTLPFLAHLLPIRPLAILTGVTMFLQQKLTPSSMDPAQAKMMSFMTLFFAFIFYGMPAGLTLYWTVNQGLSIVQTLITFRLVRHLVPPHPGAERPA